MRLTGQLHLVGGDRCPLRPMDRRVSLPFQQLPHVGTKVETQQVVQFQHVVLPGVEQAPLIIRHQEAPNLFLFRTL